MHYLTISHNYRDRKNIVGLVVKNLNYLLQQDKSICVAVCLQPSYINLDKYCFLLGRLNHPD
jgi:hypothetical protein